MNQITAEQKFTEIAGLLAPWCHRVEVTGECRRQLIEFKRLAIVASPRSNDLDALRNIRDIVDHRWGVPAEHEFPCLHTKLNRI